MTSVAQRWRHGDDTAARPIVAHVGDAQPAQLVEVRLGNFVRGYQPWTTHDVGAVIWGEKPSKPWQATWTPRTPWIELPNVFQVDITQDFSTNGVAVATIQLENVLMLALNGATGLSYHTLQRGGLSPFRGSKLDLPSADPHYSPPPNQWANYLTKNAQIRVWQGYGDAMDPAFVGMVDDVDMTSHPDQLTITARDSGQVLVDERIFGWVKSKQLPEPTRFITRNRRKGKGMGYDASASSVRAGHPARFATDTSLDTRWISADHTDDGVTEWVQVRLPRGTYDSFAIHNAYPGMEVYAAIYAHSAGLKGGCKLDGQAIDDGWVAVGNGLVPGDNGGFPWLRHWPTMSDKGNAHSLKHTLELGDGSILRIAYRNLYRVGRAYRAGTVRLAGIKRLPLPKSQRQRKVVECDDVSDVVKVCLRWAGFKEWRITEVGAQLVDDPNDETRWTFNRQNSLMDVIQGCCQTSGYVFYVEPSDDPESLGVAVFEPNQALKRRAHQTLKDADLLTGVQTKATDEPLSYIIRVRGAERKKGGHMLGSDHSRRAMAVYRPPWTTNLRLAGIIKHFIADPSSNPQLKQLKSDAECMVVAQLVALQMALQAYTGTFETAGNPGFTLNDQVAVFDEGTGLNTRVYISNRSSSFVKGTDGQESTFKTTLGGALVDVDDVRQVIADLQNTLRSMGRATDRVQLGDSFYMEID